jgi:hypothetical protein
MPLIEFVLNVFVEIKFGDLTMDPFLTFHRLAQSLEIWNVVLFLQFVIEVDMFTMFQTSKMYNLITNVVHGPMPKNIYFRERM